MGQCDVSVTIRPCDQRVSAPPLIQCLCESSFCRGARALSVGSAGQLASASSGHLVFDCTPRYLEGQSMTAGHARSPDQLTPL